MIWSDGIHVGESFTVPAGETWQAAPNARPIFARANGGPPTLDIQPGATVKDLWFGGARETAPTTAMYLHDDATADNCVFFGYYGGFAVGGHVRGKILNSKFIRMGGDTHSHPIYISNPTGPGDGILIEGNLFVGNEGWSVHGWNDSLGGTHYNQVRNNFIGTARYGIVMRGDYNIIRDNLIWSSSDLHLFLFDGVGSTFNHNLVGNATGPLLLMDWQGTRRNNTFVVPAPPYGLNSHIITRSQVDEVTGVHANVLDDTLTSIIAAFSQDINSIHTHPNILYWFNLLDLARTTWQPT